MVKKCCIKFCCSESVAGCGISFHSLPKDPELKQKWTDVISRKITKNSVVCSLHFKDNDFQIARSRRILTVNAIPSIFPMVKLKSKRTSLKYDDIMPLFNMSGKNNVDTSEINLQSPTIREDDEEDQDASKGIMSEDTTEINEVKQEMSTECRTCLQTLHPEEDVYYIFQNWVPPWEGVEDTIAEALQRIANIQLSDVDPHSKVICGTCCQKLHTACLFATLAQQSDYALWQRTSSPSDVSAEKNWPKPIQIDKNIPFDEQMEIKQEHLSDEEYSGYREVEANPNEEMEIKTEPIELIPRQVVPVQINGHYEGMSSEGLTPEISVNGDDNSQEHYMPIKEEPMSDNESVGTDLSLDCMLCTKVFSSISGLKAHVIAHHSYKSVRRKAANETSPVKRQKNEHVCATCRRSFATSTDLMVHETCHNKSACYGCNEKFDSFELVMQHRLVCKAVTREHGPLLTLEDVQRPQRNSSSNSEASTKEQVKCNFCGETFTDSYYMNIHLEIHHSAPPAAAADDEEMEVEALESLFTERA